MKAAVAGSGRTAGVQVAGGSRIIVDSSSGDVYALNAYGGATDQGTVLLWQNCPKDNPDCMWYFRAGMIVSARDTSLAIRPRRGNMQYSNLILDAKCTPENPECLWVWTRGMLQNGANAAGTFFINALDGAVQTGNLAIDTTCSDANPNCTFTIESARVSLETDPRTGLYAGSSPIAGNSASLQDIWSNGDDGGRVSWTFRRGRIYSDYDPSLALDVRLAGDHYDAWLNGQCGDSSTCYWTYDGRVIVNDPPVQGMNGASVQLALVPSGGPLTDLTGMTTTMRLGATGGEVDAQIRCADSTPSTPACAPGYLCSTNTPPKADYCVAECNLDPNMVPVCIFEVGSPEPIAWSGTPAPKAKWSILNLQLSDGGLQSDSFWAQSRMEYAGSTPDVNILVYADTDPRYGPWRTPFFRGHGIFLRVNRNASPTFLKDLGAVDMSDLGTMRDFSDFVQTYFPADNYAVIAHDHGGGWSGFGQNSAWISIPNGSTDDGNFGAYGQMLSYMAARFNQPVGVVGFNACNMGMWEVAAASAPYVQYLVASEAGSGMVNFPYALFLPQLLANPFMSPRDLATAMATSYLWDYRHQTMSAVDLSSTYLSPTGSVTVAVNAFAHALRDPAYYDCVEQARQQTTNGLDYCDLYNLAGSIGQLCTSSGVSFASLANDVKQAVADGPSHAAVATNSPGDPGDPRGLAINMPARCSNLSPDYYPCPNFQNGKGSIWSQQTEWDEFLRGFAPPASEYNLPAPALTATTSADGTSANLTWALPVAPDGFTYTGVSYALWRGTSPGAENVVVAPYPPTTPYTSTTFTDTGLDPRQTYYYTVVAMNCMESPVSNEVAVGAPTPVYKIDTGSSSAVSPFTADQYFSGGTMHSVSDAIAIGSDITNPAPMAVYQSERYGTSTYTMPNLTPGRQYTVRLHFAELYWTAAGSRKFNVVINGTTVLSNFDIYATAGARYKAVVREFTAAANSSGQIVINFNTVTNNATVGGIEIIAALPNTPPIIATPPSAAPRPVSGTTTSLSVLGADDSGESTLTYTWTGTPGTITFSANGTNAAKNTTATFTAAGTYTLQATVMDQQGLTATSPITVVVNQTLTSIVVSPPSVSVNTSATQQFNATARDQFAANLTTQPTFTWTVTGGGSLNTNGLFTAGVSTGGPYTLAARSGSVTGTASVTVTAPNAAPTIRTPAAANPNPVTGTTATLSVLGADDGGESNLTYTWATAGSPPAAVTFSANGTNAAKNTTATFTKAGSYTFQVTVKDQPGLTAISSVVVTVSQTLASIVVSPSSATVNASATQQFTATARDQFATNLTNQPTFTWAVGGGGSISSAGLFTAGTTAGGPYTVTARSGSVSGTASVTVTARNAAPTIATAARSTPSPVTGTTATLSVLGADDGGEANLTYTWATSGSPPAAVTFSANGTNAAKNTTATFTKAGSYTFQVTVKDQPGLTVTSTVTVTVNQTLTSIVLSPSTATVATTKTQQFTATARDQFSTNLTTQPTFTWTVNGGGAVSASGLFTAGSTAGGPYTVTAKNGSVSGTASVTVTSGSTPCAGLCSNPVVFTSASYQSGNLGTGATCHQTTASLTGGNCSNIGSRTLKVNNVTMNCNGWALPAKVNGGYCVQVTAGTPSYTAFSTW